MSAAILLVAMTHPSALAVGSDGPGEHGPRELGPVREVEDLSIFESMSFGPGRDPVDAVDRLAPLFGSRWLGWDLSGAVPNRVLELRLAPVLDGDHDVVAGVLGSDSKYVKIVPARYSFDDLLGFKETVLSLVEKDPIADASMIGVGIDNVLGRVEIVTMAAVPTLHDRVRDAVPRDAVEFRVEPTGALTALDADGPTATIRGMATAKSTSRRCAVS